MKTLALILICALLSGCSSPKGHETDALASSIGRNQQAVTNTQANLKKEDALQKQQDADLQELFDSLGD